LTIKVPATSANLGPGFDTLGLAVALHNKVQVEPSKVFSVSIKGEGQNNQKLKGNNLFVNTFYENFERLVGKREIFKFTFYNSIPLSRGLGSSSAAIVSAIFAAYSVAGVEIDKSEILDIALKYEHHPDNIAPAVMGGFNISMLNGDKVINIKKNIPRGISSIVVIPNKTISTAQSRKSLPHKYTKEDVIYNISRSSIMSGAFLSERWELLKEASKDKIHQDYRMKNMPELFDVQKVALDAGVLMSTLSGSGSTMFNMVYKDDIERVRTILRKRFPSYFIRSYNFDNQGATVIY
jgi:homoserine kinase